MMTDGNAASGVAAAISDDAMANAALAAAAKENERVSSVKATSDDVIEIVRQDSPAAETKKAPTVQDGTAEQDVGAVDEAPKNEEGVGAVSAPAQNDPNPDASEEKTIPPNFFQVARFVVSAAAISQDDLNEMVKRLVALTKQIRADSGLEQTPSIRVEVLQANGQLVKHEVLYVPEKLGGGYRTTQV